MTSEQEQVPLISVICPVYNAAKYVSEAVESILSQSVGDFEFIIIDDGSTDGTRDILLEYAGRDSRIRLITRRNKGLVATLNEGVDMARGRWFARMDADDIALPQRFERQLAWFVRTGAGMGGSWIRQFGSYDSRVVQLPQTDGAIKADMLFRCPFAHPTMMIDGRILREMRYDPSSKSAEDYELWVRMAVAGVKMTNVPEVLLHYRVHDAQVSATAAHEQASHTVRISRKYWHRVHSTFQLGRDDMEPVFEVAQGKLDSSDLDFADKVFSSLLRQSAGEARKVILENAFRVYLSVASVCPSAAKRWWLLCRNGGERVTLPDMLNLSLRALFKLRRQSTILRILRRLRDLIAHRTRL